MTSFHKLKINTPYQVYSNKRTQETQIKCNATFYFILQIDYASQSNLRGNTYVFLAFTKTNIPPPIASFHTNQNSSSLSLSTLCMIK